MGKTQFCRICRTVENLKYTTKELRQLNKEQLLLAQGKQEGQTSNRASKKLLLTTHTLGNICQICDQRIQIFHRLDDVGQESSSDIEVDVVSNLNGSISTKFDDGLQNGDIAQRTQRPETPVIVDDDDMLFNIFMQKFDQKTHLPRNQIISSFSHQNLDTEMSNDFHSTYTPPQSTGGGSEGDETKIIEVLTSRESTPVPIKPKPAFTTSTKPGDSQCHRIVAIIDLDDGDDEAQYIVERQKDSSPKLPPKTISAPQNTEVRSVSLSLHKSISFNHSSTVSTSQTDDVEVDEEIVFPLKTISAPQNTEDRSVSLSPHKSISFSYSSTVSTSQTDDVEDDEEIVFQKVDNQKEDISTLKKRRRKTYDEKKLRLVACLNLVSSDSETEETLFTDQVQKIPNDKMTAPSTPIINKHFYCKICEKKYPDSHSLSVHERIHQGVKCTLCKVGFPQVKRLIHHMRRKHREYNGDALSEKPRSGQDSCMTIRLRYMQQITFYECQLCGRIDEVFKEHKEHILKTHPNESKTLKDPIVKQLKCPLCKAKCGAQYLSLCRHLISSHEYPEYKSHLRELLHVSAFGWNTARQQEVAKTAKIFQFIKRKTFFFECKICCKVVAGYLHHLRHVNEHQKPFSGKNGKEIPKTNYSLKKLREPKSNKIGKTLNNDGVSVSKNLRNRESLTKLVSPSNLKNNIKQTEKVKKVSIKLPKTEKNCIKVSKFKSKYTQKAKNELKNDKCKKSEAGVKNAIVQKLNLKNKYKPKEKDIVKLRISDKLTQEKKKSELGRKDKNFKKQFSKEKDSEFKPKVKKVKVKAQIRQIDLQKYKCKYCVKKFKGFRCFNLHLISQHKENEFSKCNKCYKIFESAPNLEDHMKQCSPASTTAKRKRKISKQVSIPENETENYQPFVKKVPDKSDVSSVDLVENYLWLKDLLIIKKPLQISDSNLSLEKSPNTALLKFQCCYCLHLLGNDKDLKEHKEVNHLQNSDILLKYKPLRTL